MSKIL